MERVHFTVNGIKHSGMKKYINIFFLSNVFILILIEGDVDTKFWNYLVEGLGQHWLG